MRQLNQIGHCLLALGFCGSFLIVCYQLPREQAHQAQQLKPLPLLATYQTL